MPNDLIPVPTIDVQSYTDPAESFQAEAVWAANKAYAKEQNDFEGLLVSFTGWILQRRKTTELVRSALPGPGAYFGNQYQDGDESVTKLCDFGFSKMQFFRRCKELEVDPDVFHSYLDSCIEIGKQPSLFGMLRFSGSGSSLAGKSKYQTTLEVLAEYQKVPEEDLYPWSDDMKALWGSLHYWLVRKVKK